MHMRQIIDAGRSGWAAIIAVPLLMLSTGIELVHPAQKPDGTVMEPATFAVLVAMWGLGMLCVAATVFAIRTLHRQAAAPLSRAGRAGIWFAVTGSALQVLFAILVGVTGAVAGKPSEAAFLLFALGFLSLVVGEVLLGFAVRRARVLRSAAAPIWVGAGSALVAIAVSSPWHDIALFAFSGTWFPLGVMLLRHRRRSVPTSGDRVPATREASQPIGAMSPDSPSAAPPPSDR
jgi:multidrug transporter EmrE-like cation transporter